MTEIATTFNQDLMVRTLQTIEHRARELIMHLDSDLIVMSHDISALLEKAFELKILDEKDTARGHAFLYYRNHQKYKDPNSTNPPRIDYSQNVAVLKGDGISILKCIQKAAKSCCNSHTRSPGNKNGISAPVYEGMQPS